MSSPSRLRYQEAARPLRSAPVPVRGVGRSIVIEESRITFTMPIGWGRDPATSRPAPWLRDLKPRRGAGSSSPAAPVALGGPELAALGAAARSYSITATMARFRAQVVLDRPRVHGLQLGSNELAGDLDGGASAALKRNGCRGRCDRQPAVGSVVEGRVSASCRPPAGRNERRASPRSCRTSNVARAPTRGPPISGRVRRGAAAAPASPWG